MRGDFLVVNVSFMTTNLSVCVYADFFWDSRDKIVQVCVMISVSVLSSSDCKVLYAWYIYTR